MSSTDGVNVREAGLDNKRNKPRRKNKKKCKVCGGSAKGLGRKNILSIQSDNVLPGVRLFKKKYISATHTIPILKWNIPLWLNCPQIMIFFKNSKIECTVTAV